MHNLRELAMRGGAYLSMRLGLGVTLNFGGILLLTRTIGPANYGLYAVALGTFMFLQYVSLWGVEVYLVRREGEEGAEVYHQGFTLLLLLGSAGAGLAIIGFPLLERWVTLDGLRPVALAMFCSLPVVLLGKIPLAILERALDYKKVALFELAGLFVFYLTSLPLAFAGAGAASPVAGWWAQQLLIVALLFPGARYLPRLYWEGAEARRMIRYGLSFSASMWVWQARDLVNPMIVSKFLGAEAAAYVDLSIRFVRGLSFVKEAMWRLSIAALGKIQQDRPRLVRAVSEGMKLQVIAQGPLLVGFGFVAYWFLPLVVGEKWGPVMQIYPFIALGYLVNAGFNLHSSTLYVLRKNSEVVVFHLVHLALFAGTAFVLVSRVGLVGYGLAEVVALGSYLVVHHYFAKELGSPDYWLSGAWMLALAMSLFVHQIGWWSLLGLGAVALWPRTWRELWGYASSMWNIWKAREA